MPATCQNGWPALEQGSPLLYTWVVPAKTGTTRLTLRNGSAGFVLAHFALWYAETIEPLVGKVLDDWGWAYRPVRGQTVDLSNHSGGLAVDLDATEHPRGKDGTFAPAQVAKIHRRMRLVYRNVLRWGQDYQHSPKDGMHWEVVQPLAVVERLARLLMHTPRGRRILKANPSQKAVILS